MPENPRKALTVLYDEAITKIMNRLLLREGVETTNTFTYEEAVKQLRDKIFDIVLTDWTKVEGAEIVRLSQERGIPKIIVATGGYAPAQELREQGVLILEKPFMPQDLIDVVNG